MSWEQNNAPNQNSMNKTSSNEHPRRGKPKRFKPCFTRDRRMTAYHEAGHLTAAEQLVQEADVCLEHTGSEPTVSEKCVIGHTIWFPPTTPFNDAIIGWAGLIAEEVCRRRMWHGEDALATNDFENVWQRYGEEGIGAMSDTDRRSIGSGRMSRKAFKAAVVLLRKNRRELERNARRLIRSLPPPNSL